MAVGTHHLFYFFACHAKPHRENTDVWDNFKLVANFFE